MNKTKSNNKTLGRGAKLVGHGFTAIIKIPANGIVKGANMIVSEPQKKMAMEEGKMASGSKEDNEIKTLSQGMIGLGKGFLKGVTGVVTDPYRGAQVGGFKGFVHGVGSGVVGVVARPAKGVADFMESVDQTIDGKNRSVPPNYFSSSLKEQTQLCHQGKVPDIMFQCMSQLYVRGINVKGIFRRTGNHLKIQETRKLLETGKDVCFEDLDIMVIASIFKLWLRQLPKPLIPVSYYSELITMGSRIGHLVKEEDVMKWKISLRKIIISIGDPELQCLGVLFLFLSKVTKNSEINNMSARSLATVMAPNILYKTVHEDMVPSKEAVIQTAQEMSNAMEIIRVLIEEVEFFFFPVVESASDSKNEEKEDSLQFGNSNLAINLENNSFRESSGARRPRSLLL